LRSRASIDLPAPGLICPHRMRLAAPRADAHCEDIAPMPPSAPTTFAQRIAGPLVVALLLALLAAGSTWWMHVQGYTQYYGDAQAHLNIARRVLDSQTPGVLQIGTVWLPLPHLLMMPLAGDDALWANGLAGAIPVSVCFWLAGMLFFAACRRITESFWAAFAALLVFAFNPNLLYLQATPMTEPIFFACLAGILWACVAFAANPGLLWATTVAVFALGASLTRYDGWVLLPFLALFLVWKGGEKRWSSAIVFCLVAGAGPLWWLAHNWWFWGDALEFYRGPYSAKAIYARQLAAGMSPYPGDNSYLDSLRYFFTAARLGAGWPLMVLGLAGAGYLLVRGPRWAALLLLLPGAFYVQSMQNAGTPIFVPDLWPNAYYNTRYGLALLPLLALGVGSLVKLMPPRQRPFAAALALLGCMLPWLLQPGLENWVVWKESEVNSRTRRAWLGDAASYMLRIQRPGEEILLSFGDPTGVLQLAGIPLRQSLHEGNHPRFRASLNRPEYFLWSEWALCQSGDEVCRAMQRAASRGLLYAKVREIRAGNAAPLEIWRRRSAFDEKDMRLPRMLPGGWPPVPRGQFTPDATGQNATGVEEKDS
jgi:hypothetical protein